MSWKKCTLFRALPCISFFFEKIALIACIHSFLMFETYIFQKSNESEVKGQLLVGLESLVIECDIAVCVNVAINLCFVCFIALCSLEITSNQIDQKNNLKAVDNKRW